MKTIELKIYDFEELSEKAKKKALSNIDLDHEFEFHQEEATQTIEAFQRIFPIKWKEIDYANGYYRANYVGEDNHRHLSGIRLLKLLENRYLHYVRKGKYRSTESSAIHPCLTHQKLSNGKVFHAFYSRIFFEYDSCPLTGVCYDYEILQPILDFRKKPDNTTFEELLESCIESLVKSMEKEYEYCNSDEAKIEYIASYGMQFLEDGSKFDH